MNAPTREEIEASVKEHIEKIQDFTFNTLGNVPSARELVTYVMANLFHAAEMMLVAQVDMSKCIDLTTEIFKSVYQQCEETEKENENEEAK